MVRRRGAARAIAAPSPAAPAPDDGYASLTAAEVLADLPSLDAEQLLIVKAFEEAGEGRAVILDRIADLLVVRQAARHLAVTPTGVGAPDPTGARPRGDKAVSPELVDQMGSLLAKSAARRTSEAARPIPSLDGPAVAPVPPAKAKRNGRRQPPNGVIVPTGGHRLNTARAGRVLIGLIILALLAGGAGLYWQRSHRSDTALILPPPPNPLASLVVKTAPTGYIEQAGAAGSGPSNLAAAAQQDGAADAATVLTQDGFVQGYHRLWTTANGQEALKVFVYQFRTAAGTATYAARTVAMDRASAVSRLAAFGVAGIPGAVGLEATSPHLADVFFVRGTYWVTISTVGPSAGNLAQQYAAAEYALIPPA